MNSCLYKCTVMHHRKEPRENKFSYSIYMFMIDLDELDTITKKIKIISHNRFNIFSFSDKHHANFPSQLSKRSEATKVKILEYLSGQGHDIKQISRISLLTNLTTLGHVFNPISVYYCYNKKEELVCSIGEVSNTFGEMKLYLLGAETKQENAFVLHTPKLFYVSPFSELDICFRFIIKQPDDIINLRVDDYKGDNCFFKSNLTGEKKKMTNALLCWYFLCFPMITLKIITLIHWQAFILYLKKVPFIRKANNIQLQQNLVKQ